jgi:LmbE family N-acetylglucosaminyl deacetylase
MGYSKLMIVAHPDDEILFGGAPLIQEKGWLVVCVTNGNHPVRSKEFERAMKAVGAEYEMWSYEDRWGGAFDRKDLKKDIRKLLAEKPVSKVVTHGLGGEYGHTQHIALSRLLHDIVKENLYVFELSDRELEPAVLAKKLALLKYYKSQDLQDLDHYIRFTRIKPAR